MFQWFRSPKKSRRPARRPDGFKPVLEYLEDRFAPATLTVTNNSDTGVSGDGSLRGEIAAANSGDTIIFASSVTSPITLTMGVINLNKSLTIQGPGAASLAVSGNNASQIFTIAAGAVDTISGLTLTKGQVTNGSGGAISDSGSLFLLNDVLSANTATSNGAAAAHGGAVAIAANNSGLTIVNSTLSGNTATSSGSGSATGGAVNDTSYYTASGVSINVVNCTFTGNVATNSGTGSAEGGAFYDEDAATDSVTGCTFTGNTASITNAGSRGAAEGGGVFTDEHPTFISCNIAGNTATSNGSGTASGGGLYNEDTLTMTGCAITGNTASNTGTGNVQGGGLYNDDTLTMTNCTISGNTASTTSGTAEGGGVLNFDTLVMQNCSISNNTATATTGTVEGGGLYNDGTLTMTNCTITGNAATSSGTSNAEGGGLLNFDTLNMQYCSIAGNTAKATGTGNAEGGGLYNDDTLNLTACTIAGNTASSTSGNAEGGGLLNSDSMNLKNATIAGNTAAATTGAGLGGGIYQDSTLHLLNCTITGNSATGGAGTGGGGLYNDSSSSYLANSIIATNTTTASGKGPDVFTAIAISTSDHDLFGILDANATITTSTGDKSGTAAAPLNPMLGALANNGGPTIGAPGNTAVLQTEAELTGSPALAAGDVGAVASAFDERGPNFARITSGAVDIGAFQFQNVTLSVTISAAPTSVAQGGGTTLTVTVTNTSGNALPAGDATVTITLPAGLKQASGTSLTFTVGALAAGQSATFTTFVIGNTVGAQTVTATVASPDTVPTSISGSTTITVTSATPPIALNYIAIGTDAGGGPQVTVFNSATNAVVTAFYAFSPTFTGGVRVAVDDINGDGVPDIICAAGPGGGPQVIVIDGTKLNQLQSNGQIANSALIASFYAFNAPSFTGGVYVAAATASSGQNWLVVGAGAGGSSQVTVYTAKAIVTAGQTGANPASIANFFAFTPSFTGGVTVAVGDTTGSGKLNVICGAGVGGGPQVIVVNGNTFGSSFTTQSNGQVLASSELASFFAFSPSFTGGVFVSGGVFSGRYNLIIGAGPGGGPQVIAVNGSQLTQLQSNGQIANSAVLDSFFAMPTGFAGGVRVGFDAAFGMTPRPAILTAAGPGGSPELNVFDPVTQKSIDAYFFLPQSFTGGAFASA